MDNKRKASTTNEAASASEAGDRAAKRRRVPLQSTEHFNLLEGESPESTSAYGLSFLEQIRRTTDKNGRNIAGHFEKLPPRRGNDDYYERIRLPISLETIERKLQNREFSTLTEVEAYFKRMVNNAKEFHSRGSQVYEDAERVRKALSNYMVKTNPAYQLIPGFSCQATPLPEDDEVEAETTEDNGRDAAQDDEGAEEEQQEGEKEDGGSGEEENEEEVDEEDEGSDAGPRSIVLKRKGSRRSQRGSVTSLPKSGEKWKGKPDHEYEGIPYKGLNFQQAQEKIVEEMIRAEDEDEPGWMKYEPFLNLPPRSLKEYFAIITDPMSLRGLQKLVKGIRGRQPATGVSEFKNWAQFEEKASLLWDNAHYFNEEGSAIYNLATELKEFFEAQVQEAKEAVPEPAQPKIKLKVPTAQESPTPAPAGSKRITIHVGGGSRSSTFASPAPATGQSADSNSAETSHDPGLASDRQEPGRNGTATAPSPSPSMAAVKQEPSNRATPANVTARTDGPSAPSAQPTANADGSPAQANGHRVAPPAPPKPLYDGVYRAPERGLADALITNLVIRTHPSIHAEKRFKLEVAADAKLAQQSVTVLVPSSQFKLQIIPKLPPLEQQQRQYRLFVILNGTLLGRSAPIPVPGDHLQLTANTPVFDAVLMPGPNLIELQMVAALPKGQKLSNGAECELEKITVVAHLLR
ncbi:hypothetical protein VTK73DRAFT_2135 [Phialemonium thermophilum]|uniref:Bromo domain-containing protein n=1 Tax=Phialemonium thermophilum TaxID=223376 RepID=A0ABR3X6J9_9PEZI